MRHKSDQRVRRSIWSFGWDRQQLELRSFLRSKALGELSIGCWASRDFRRSEGVRGSLLFTIDIVCLLEVNRLRFR